MNNDILINILDILDGINSRLVNVENSLTNLDIGDYSFYNFGDESGSIEEIRKLIQPEPESNK
jgi:hypothetical protein